MDKNNGKNIVEVAKKKRQIYLLQKLQQQQSLSRAEIKEIEEYFRAPSLPPGIVESQEKVAQAFGVAVRTVERWAKDGMPRRPDGTYSLADIQEWRYARKLAKTAKPSSRNKIDWETEYRKNKALLAEIELKERMGELVPLADVKREIVREFVSVKNKLLALPRVLAPQVAGLEVRQAEDVIRRRMLEIINDFSRGEFIYEQSAKLSQRRRRKKPD